MKIAFVLSIVGTILLGILDSRFFILMIFCSYLLYCTIVDEGIEKKEKNKKKTRWKLDSQ